MLPVTPSLDLSIQNVIAACHKETQTSATSLKDSCTSTNSQDKGTLKIFEFSEVFQDPKRPREITIIKDVFADEIHDHNISSDSTAEDAIANRYRYCREVIKPYLKDYPKDCPVSDEQLIRDALDAAQEDFPDYEPCFEIYDDTQQNPDEKDSSPKLLKENPSSVLSKDSRGSSCKRGKHVKSDISKSNLSRNSTSTNLTSKMDQDKEGCPEKKKPKGCPTKSKPECPPPIEVCKDDSMWPPSGSPSVCNVKALEGTSRCKDKPSSAGPCKETPAATPPKIEKSCEKNRNDMSATKRKFGIESNSSLTPPKQKTMMEAHSETIATIKTAVEDFFGKVYQTTKDAVTIIKTESAKHLGRITAKKSDDILPQKVHENKSTETITSFNYFRSTDNPDSKSQSTDNEEVDDNLNKAGQVIGKIFAKVDSTLSMLSDQIDLQKVKSLLTFEDLTNRNSAFDKVKGNEEEPPSTATSVPGSVFSAIKTRIVSMFSDAESPVKESVSKNSSVSGESSNEGIKIDDKRKKR